MEMPLWFSNLTFWSIQVALLVLAAGFLARALRIQQPRVLLASWRSLLAISLVLPFVQPWHRPQAIVTIAIATDFSGVPLPPASSPTASHWHFPSLQSLAPYLGLLILVGIALRFTALVLGLLKLRRLRQASWPIASSADGTGVLQAVRSLVPAPAEFRFSSQVDSPVTFGFLAPVVLLPERFASLDLRFQSAIACHELLHVRRRDWAHHLGEEALRALFWFHPAIAWLISRVRLAREQVVDLEVVRLTNARKSYLEALLEFTNARTSLTAIPAPPFLAERQLIERVSLMLKEVRMSRKRLIGSLTLISCCLALVVAVAAWAFPLRGAPLAAQSAPKAGITGGVSGGISGGVKSGVSGGVAAGVEGGISGDVGKRLSVDEPSVDYSTIWTDTVKKGPMMLQARGQGTLVRAEDSTNLVARVTLSASVAASLKPGQPAAVNTQKGPLAKGHVSSISPSTSGDTRTVDVVLDGAPEGASVGLKVDTWIDIEKLDNVLYIGRPIQNGAAAMPNSTASLYKIVNDGKEAVRVNVKLGRQSVNTVEVLDGLQVGDKIILSDMSSVNNADRVRLTDEQHLLHH
jgi:beta-lactamase regulating signal transducer with metallopeptidase domain